MNKITRDPISARRRILRGTFAAPAVMTLASGSTFAGTSLTCVARQQTSPITAPAAPDNTWVRVRVWISKNGGSGNYGKLVAGSDVASLVPPGGSYLSTSEWQYVATFGNVSYTVGQKTTSPNPTPVLASPAEFVAVRVDGAGKIVGVQGVSTANTALHVSCWTSFGGVHPF